MVFYSLYFINDCIKIASGTECACVLWLLISWNVSVLHKVKRATGAPAWLSQLSVWHVILVQVMISRFVRLSSVLGSVLTLRSLLGILSPSLSASLSLSQNKSVNIKKKERKKGKRAINQEEERKYTRQNFSKTLLLSYQRCTF